MNAAHRNYFRYFPLQDISRMFKRNLCFEFRISNLSYFHYFYLSELPQLLVLVIQKQKEKTNFVRNRETEMTGKSYYAFSEVPTKIKFNEFRM